MKSSISRQFLFIYQWYFILFVIIDSPKEISSAIIPSNNIASLYTSNDKINILTGQNLTSIIYQSKTAWLVEFYASWCGHCKSYANTFREVGIDTLAWKTVVRIGAINCYAEDNQAACDEQNIEGYPTLRFIPPESSFGTVEQKNLIATDSKDVERELIKQLSAVHRSDRAWPRFTPIDQDSFDEFYQRISSSIKLILLIIEKHDDYTGRQIILDFSKYYEQLAIFRTTPNGNFWLKFGINVTDIPGLFIVFQNRTIERIDTKQQNNENIGSRNAFNHAIRSYIHQRKLIDNFNDDDLDEIISSRNALKEAQQKKQPHQSQSLINKNMSSIKVNILDMETALSYMLRREIPRIKYIQGEIYDALVNWINVLIKYFPGREPIMNYLDNLLLSINQYDKDGLTGKEFRELTESNTENSYLPNNQVQYHFCLGSSSEYRGYPCALWILFHTLTVAQVKSDQPQINVTEIPLAIKNFIKYFFSCRHCSENFQKETKDINQLNLNDRNSAMIYLWKIHNHVNQRLHGDVTEDPQFPKIQFPSKNLCANCQSTNNVYEFELKQIIEFLQQYYSEENIDFTLAENFLNTNQNEISMIELNDESKSKLSSLMMIIQQFPFYFLVFLVILIFYIRKKYFNGKRKRYTL